MSRIRIIVLLCLALLISPTFVSFDSSAASNSGILISEVYPKEEAFSLINIGNDEVDLKGHLITDGEGSIEISKSVRLSPGGKITFAKENTNNYFVPDTWVIEYSSDCLTKKGNFILADSGDELSLYYNSDLLDSVCYGNSGGINGWMGDPAKISSGQYLLRKNSIDTDSAEDWVSIKRGWTNTQPYEYSFDARVSPFSFPEDKGSPILYTLMNADTSIDISIYLVTSREIISTLCQKAENGVKVRMLVEGSPLGVDISSELSLLKSVEDNGGEIRLINYAGADNCRYAYLHNKYALVDGNTTIITSENWTSSNIGEYGNRGWGAIIESTEYAGYMRTVFDNDFSTTWGDVSPLSTVYPNLKSNTALNVPSIEEIELDFYQSVVTPTVSPDNSFSTLKQFIYSSEERLYAEQMDLGGSLSGTTGSTPISWMSDISSNGIDTKLILDCSQTDSETHTGYLNMIGNTTSIKAVGFYEGERFDLIHNKGLISDSSVWLGSVNWTETSFLRNRETAVIISSKEVTDYFANLFEMDFGTNIFTVMESGLNLRADVVDVEIGKVIKLTVDGPAGYTYKWVLGNAFERETQYPSVLFDAPSDGEYVATVRIEGFDIEESITVSVRGLSDSETDPILIYALGLAVTMPILGTLKYVVRQKKTTRKNIYNRRNRYS